MHQIADAQAHTNTVMHVSHAGKAGWLRVVHSTRNLRMHFDVLHYNGYPLAWTSSYLVMVKVSTGYMDSTGYIQGHLQLQRPCQHAQYAMRACSIHRSSCIGNSVLRCSRLNNHNDGWLLLVHARNVHSMVASIAAVQVVLGRARFEAWQAASYTGAPAFT